MATDVGHGSSVGFATLADEFFGEILNIAWGGMARGAVETTHMGTTGGDTFVPTDTYDPGELTVEVNCDTADTPLTALTGAPEILTVTLNDGAGGTNSWSGTAFMTGYNNNIPDKDKMTATIIAKFSGSITIA